MQWPARQGSLGTQLTCCLVLLHLGSAAAARSLLDTQPTTDQASAEPQASSQPAGNTTRVPKFSGHSRLQAQKHMQHLGNDLFVEVPERQLVVAQHREDLAWLEQVSYIPHVVYQADNTTAARGTVKNMREAAVYLQYIVEHYDKLPKWMAFVHGHQCSEHMPDKVDVLQKLQWGKYEYANLRYENITLAKWGAWTGDYLHPGQPQEGPGRAEVVWGEEQAQLSALFAQLWAVLFEGELGPLPEWVHSPCCAEFVVSKARVRSHPRRFYVDMLDWLTYTTQDRYNAGLILEYVWHIVFGEPPIYHAPAQCDLLHCEPSSSS